MAVKTFKVMRRRRDGEPDARWVEMGTCVVNADEGTGSLYLNASDQTWRLFEKVPYEKRKPAVPDQAAEKEEGGDIPF